MVRTGRLVGVGVLVGVWVGVGVCVLVGVGVLVFMGSVGTRVAVGVKLGVGVKVGVGVRVGGKTQCTPTSTLCTDETPTNMPRGLVVVNVQDRVEVCVSNVVSEYELLRNTAK